jgi:hypothetical protein
MYSPDAPLTQLLALAAQDERVLPRNPSARYLSGFAARARMSAR